jgi:hypothetical protein
MLALEMQTILGLLSSTAPTTNTAKVVPIKTAALEGKNTCLAQEASQ